MSVAADISISISTVNNKYYTLIIYNKYNILYIDNKIDFNNQDFS